MTIQSDYSECSFTPREEFFILIIISYSDNHMLRHSNVTLLDSDCITFARVQIMDRARYATRGLKSQKQSAVRLRGRKARRKTAFKISQIFMVSLSLSASIIPRRCGNLGGNRVRIIEFYEQRFLARIDLRPLRGRPRFAPQVA